MIDEEREKIRAQIEADTTFLDEFV